MFKQQINALQVILDNVKLPINPDNVDDNLIKEINIHLIPAIS